MTEMETVGAEGLTADEQAYFDSQGVMPEPAEPELVAEDEDSEPEPASNPDPKARTVPHGALHAEREKRKAIETRLREIETQKAILEDRWNQILKAQQQPAKEEAAAPAQAKDPMPDPDQDLFGYAKWAARQIEKLQTDREAEQQQKTQVQQQTAEEQQVWNAWREDVAAFQTQTPDFGDAAKFLADRRMAELTFWARTTPALNSVEARNAVINDELARVVKQAKALGQSPAAIIYEYAKMAGYKGAAPAPEAAPEPAAPPEMPQQLAKVAKAQEAAKSLSAAGGSGAAGPLSVEDLLAMPADEFDRWSSANPKMWKKLMGG